MPIASWQCEQVVVTPDPATGGTGVARPADQVLAVAIGADRRLRHAALERRAVTLAR
jgi:hypothetical protein